jgi:hypothetical protein
MEGPTETLQGRVTKGFVEVAVVENGLPNMPRLPLRASEPLAAISHPRHAFLPGPYRWPRLRQCRWRYQEVRQGFGNFWMLRPASKD